MHTGHHSVCNFLTLRIRRRGGATIGHPKHIMHYEKKFNNEREALVETLQWLGATRYKILARAAKTECIENIAFYMGIAGISGFPVNAMHRRYHTN